jgi:IS5 family transposase
MRQLYREVMAITRAIVRQAEGVNREIPGRADDAMAKLGQRLAETVGLVRRVLAQTRARVLKGDTHYPEKVLSLFEPHTEAIRKGKVVKPTEFGKLVKLQEAEAQFITDYTVCATRVSDQDLWVPALDRHEQLFGRPPRLAVADAGFASASNEQAATGRGVRRVALPKRGRLPSARGVHQRQRWFRRALRWRAGIEARISTLKHPFSMLRATYKGDEGFQRYVGWCVITQNLVSMARTLVRRKANAG